MVVGSALRDAAGERLGKVDDLIVRLVRRGYPPITGFLASVAGRQSFLAAEQVAEMDAQGVTLRRARLDLERFERRPEEVLLKEDVLDHQLINVDGARLVRANEIELARRGGLVARRRRRHRPARGRSRACCRAGSRRGSAPASSSTGRASSRSSATSRRVRLRVPHPKLAKLHPAQIADLVEAASHREGEEIIAGGRCGRPELEADVFEELDDQHQVEFIEERTDAEVAAACSRAWSPTTPPTCSTSSTSERREAVLALLPAVQRTPVRALLGYDPATAGGLMSPEFVCLYRQATASEALERVAREPVPADALTTGLRHGHAPAAGGRRSARRRSSAPSPTRRSRELISASTPRRCAPTPISRRSRG